MTTERNNVHELEEAAKKLRIEFPPELPVSQAAPEILAAWKHHQVIIVGGDTGSGKTTQLPKIALSLGCGRRGRIGCTQPRRIAAGAMARRVADETGSTLGDAVGYQVRFDDHTGKNTVLKFMTDGILLAETRADRDLKQYDCLIIDEAHERSLNIDFLLGYLKKLLLRRPDLKIAISSATLDMEQFSKFFFDAPVIAVKGRTFPVEDVFLPPDADEDMPDHIARAVEFASELDVRGDILIFLPGEREIRECAALLEGRKFPRTEVLTLFARLSAADQQKVFHPGNMRRIVISTNVAETSVTIPRIRFVIDSGLARVKRYNPRSRIEELQIEFISQSSARQRRGRCGRIADGVCIHLYSEHDLEQSSPYTDPEIRRCGLAGVILQMAALRLGKISHFPFIDPPPSAAIREGERTLEDIRAITPDGRLTRDGFQLAAIPLDPHIGRMLLSAKEYKVLPEMLAIAAFLSIQDPRERPQEKQQSADEAHRKYRHPDSDFLSILKLWNAVNLPASRRLLRNFCRDNFLSYNRVCEWKNLVRDVCELPGDKAVPFPEKIDEEHAPADFIHLAVLSGIPRNVGRYFKEGGYYVSTMARHFQIFPGSGLFKRKNVPEWLMSFTLVETSRVFARMNAAIRPDLIERAAGHLCTKSYDNVAYDVQSTFVYAREKISLGGLPVNPGRRVHYARINPAEARKVFIADGLARGLVNLPGQHHWVAKHNALLEELKLLELKVRRPDSIVDEEAVAQYYLELLPPEVNSGPSLRDFMKRDMQDYCIGRADAMQEQYVDFDEKDYPDFLTFFGQKFPLHYEFDPGEDHDGITLIAKTGMLPLLPDYALDYLVPGFLPDKVELMIRALPKELRQQCSPIMESVQSFCRDLKAGKIFAEQSLRSALAEFLSERAGTPISPADFGEFRLPQYLQMKLLERTGNGREILHTEIPSSAKNGSKLSPIVARRSGLKSAAPAKGSSNGFGLETLEKELLLPNGNGKTAYPALCIEEDAVRSSLFLKESEAHYRHERAILKLFRDGHADQLKFVKRMFRIPNEMKLSWAMDYPGFSDDLTDDAILRALDAAPWEIRSQDALTQSFDGAKQQLGEAGDELMAELNRIYEAYAKVKNLLPKARQRSRGAAAEVDEHLGILFRPGFLQSYDFVFGGDYLRYLRGLALRTERIAGDPYKDETKGEPIREYVEKFMAALASCDDLHALPGLEEFWHLTEEARLAVYAPEVPQSIRGSVKKLAEAWEDLRFT